MRMNSFDLPVVSAEAAAKSYDHYLASTTIDSLSLAQRVLRHSDITLN